MALPKPNFDSLSKVANQNKTPPAVSNLSNVFSLKQNDSPMSGVTRQDFNKFSGNLFKYLDKFIVLLTRQEAANYNEKQASTRKHLEDDAKENKRGLFGKALFGVGVAIKAFLAKTAFDAGLVAVGGIMGGAIRGMDDSYEQDLRDQNETKEAAMPMTDIIHNQGRDTIFEDFETMTHFDSITAALAKNLEDNTNGIKKTFDAVLDFLGISNTLGEPAPTSTPSNTVVDNGTAESFGESQMGGQYVPSTHVNLPPPSQPVVDATAPTRQTARDRLNQPSLTELAPPPPVRSTGEPPPNASRAPSSKSALANAISRGEGTTDADAKKHNYKSEYDITYGYGKYDKIDHKPVSEMTLGEVDALQTHMLDRKLNPDNKERTSAVGKWQIVQTTLREFKQKLGLKDTDKFSPEVQDKIFESLMNRRGAKDYESGKISEDQFIDNLGKEWSSVRDRPTVTNTAQVLAVDKARKPKESSVQIAENNVTNNSAKTTSVGGGMPNLSAIPSDPTLARANSIHLNQGMG